MPGILDNHKKVVAASTAAKPDGTTEGDMPNLTSEGEFQEGTSDEAKNTFEQTGGVEPDPSGIFKPEMGNSPDRVDSDNTGATDSQLDQGVVEGAVGMAGSVPVQQVAETPTSAAPKFVITDSAPVQSRRGPRTEADAIFQESEDYVPEEIKPVAAYKHRSVRHFKVGNFEFKNHLLFIFTNEANDAFLDCFDALEPRDQSAIVVYDHEAAARVETAVGTRTQRGAMSTSRIKDPKTVA